MNDTLDLLARHRSIRRFRDEPLDERAVRAAVAAAQHASTSSNIQAYSLLRVRDAGKREQLVELTGGQPQVAACGGFFVVCGDQRRHALAAEAAESAYAPNLETFLLAAVDASLFAQNLCLAFESLGYGICYIGGLRNRLAEADELLELPEHVLPLYGLCVGVPDQEPSLRPRLPVDAVLFDDRYPDDETVLASLAEYDRTMAAYYAERGKPGYTWTGGITRKFARENRAHLAGFYRSKGARLS
ncbi:MAG: oxygen-insensitive NADPH nitroreductase [Planctomycetota bacterium]